MAWPNKLNQWWVIQQLPWRFACDYYYPRSQKVRRRPRRTSALSDRYTHLPLHHLSITVANCPAQFSITTRFRRKQLLVSTHIFSASELQYTLRHTEYLPSDELFHTSETPNGWSRFHSIRHAGQQHGRLPGHGHETLLTPWWSMDANPYGTETIMDSYGWVHVLTISEAENATELLQYKLPADPLLDCFVGTLIY